ncbi:MAG: TldD/PmbA family protein [Candidatus Magnetominusculus sp. LBB02]|nr:TldD/PmbA family protein [Candidatus Magnetominusculus sp. LBB02]
MKTEALINEILGYLSSRKGLRGEVYLSSAKNITAEAKEGSVDALERAEAAGLSVRIIAERRHGFSYTNDISKWRETADKAAETAAFTERDDNWSFYAPLLSKDCAQCGVMVYDEAAASLLESDIVDMALRVERAALAADNKVKKVRKAAASVSSGGVYIANTEGLSAGYQFTSCSLSATAMAEFSGDSQMGWDYEYDRTLAAVSPERVGAAAAARALMLLNARKFKPAKAPVVIENSVAADFLSLIASSLSSESVQKGKSMLAGKISQKIVSEKINIIDSALFDGKAGSRPFDGEGVPSERNVLIDNGVLKGFLYNLYTAKKGGGVSTANAVRSGISGMPTVGVSNLCIEPSRPEYAMALDEMFSAAGSCLFVTDAMGIHMANRITGEFSVGVSGLWIEGGRVAYPIKEAVISGNFLDMFNDVDAVGDDLRFYGKIGSPSLLIRQMDISG